MSFRPHDVVMGTMLATVLDYIMAHLPEKEGMRLAVYVGREDDPENAYLVGNVEPAQLHAAIGVLVLDAERLGTIMRDGTITEEPR